MSEQIEVDPEFFLVFCAWFNVDLIDLDDQQEVENTAGVCASDLNNKIQDIDKLIFDLSAMLSQWNPQVAMRFIKATDTDWLADQQIEQTLKDIIRQIIKGLEHFQQNRK